MPTKVQYSYVINNRKSCFFQLIVHLKASGEAHEPYENQ